MLGRTHAAAGIASLWVLRPVPGAFTPENAALLSVLAVIGALLPDLDAADSLLKRQSIGGIAPLVPLASLLHAGLGHRGATHSLLGLGTVLLLSLPVAGSLGWAAHVALGLGYLSHLLCDAATRSGIPLLYPRRRRYHLLPRAFRLTTGSDVETLVFVLFAALALGLLVSLLPVAARELSSF